MADPQPPQVIPPNDDATRALGRLVGTLAEDAMFALAAAGWASPDTLSAIAKRRADAYAGHIEGQPLYTMRASFDYWLVEMARAVAPHTPPVWLPMNELLREKVTLEVGARGLRSLFSTKPSEKDVARVKRLGTLGVRILRSVFAADGVMDPDEERLVAAFIASLGLDENDAAPLYASTPILVGGPPLEMQGDLEPAIARALLRGAWSTAASDGIDPREELVVRTLAQSLPIPEADIETLRAEAVAKVDARRTSGQALLEAVRYLVRDRFVAPSAGAALVKQVAALTVPRRHRDAALGFLASPEASAAPLAFDKGHRAMSTDERAWVLAFTWAAALHDDPTVGRKAILRARYDQVAAGLNEDGARPRVLVEEWIGDVLSRAAASLR